MLHNDEELYDHWLQRDLPLRLCFNVRNNDLVQKKIRSAGVSDLKRRWMITRMAFYAELVKAYPTGKWFSYSRSRAWYVGKSRYYKVPVGHDILTNIVDQASQHGLVESKIAERLSSRQSIVRATQKLVDIFKDADVELFHHASVRLTDREMPTEAEVVRWIKNRNKKDHFRRFRPKVRLIPFEDTDETKIIERDINYINLGLQSVRLECPGLFEQESKFTDNIGSYIKFDDKCVLITDLRLHRSFCRGSFQKGGRFYGWYQSQPKETRSKFLIDGEEVCEPDFSRYHAHILYALRGVQLSIDPYEVKGISVEIAKLAFLVIINAENEKLAKAAIRGEFRKEKMVCPRRLPGEIISSIKSAHPLIADDIHNDMGVSLMNEDASIMNDILIHLTQEKIVGLPVHDSIICKKSNVERVKQIMGESYSRRFPGMICPVK